MKSSVYDAQVYLENAACPNAMRGANILEVGDKKHLDLADASELLSVWDGPRISKIWSPTSPAFKFGDTTATPDAGYKLVYDGAVIDININGRNLELTPDKAESVIKELQYMLGQRK